MWRATTETLNASFDKYKDEQNQLDPTRVGPALAEAGIVCSSQLVSVVMDMYLKHSRQGLGKASSLLP